MSLHALIDAGRGWDAEYASGLSNHLPMALTALAALGADEARLQQFAAGYSTRLRPAPAREEWPAGDPWAGRLGDVAAWPAYRSLFGQWLQYESVDAVLAQALPQLMPGVGAAAFHGLIRVAAALRAGHADELADALAYWACRWLDLGQHQAAGRVADPARLLARLPAAATSGGLIFERMRAAAAQPGFNAVVAQWKPGEQAEQGLARLARLAARIHAASGGFTALHLVTSAHAMRLLLPFVDEPLPALRSYWRAFAAAVAASGAADGALPDPRPWDELVAAALAQADDHVIKLVDACREEQQAHGGDCDWQRAATRALAGA
ncbi:conserved hypothetical protein [Rubrivivax sp. A210]|uniref:questin oxidase family protein n=1 Tax=Rubrivivax sp. A210 TaxID=2772301 RepID=UPI0019180ABF|nr:questin oxidase family protein [Rubrivivax sp. A210]CAD5370125.1 conserved hypothetical protein [Rubrivivax sp. A210]